MKKVFYETDKNIYSVGDVLEVLNNNNTEHDIIDNIYLTIVNSITLYNSKNDFYKLYKYSNDNYLIAYWHNGYVNKECFVNLNTFESLVILWFTSDFEICDYIN